MVVLNGMKGSQSWTTGNRLNFQPCKCTKIDVAIFKNIIFDLKFARDKILIGSFTPKKHRGSVVYHPISHAAKCNDGFVQP